MTSFYDAIKYFNSGKLFEYTAVIVAISTAVQLLSYSLRFRINPDKYASYRVSFLGPPGVGKTSALTCALYHLIGSEFSPYIRLRGPNTISIVRAGVQSIADGTFLNKTTEDKTDIYRFDYFPPTTFFRRIINRLLSPTKAFRVELADFAGEFTDNFSYQKSSARQSNIPSSFGDDAPQNFLKWISESDKCLLLIDAGKYMEHGQNFVEHITAEYIAFWQNYLDIHSEQFQPQAGTPVSIVFSKCDLLDKAHTDSIRKSFSRLEIFLTSNSRNLSVLFISVLPGEEIGLNSLAAAILPHTRWQRRKGISRSDPSWKNSEKKSLPSKKHER